MGLDDNTLPFVCFCELGGVQRILQNKCGSLGSLSIEQSSTTTVLVMHPLYHFLIFRTICPIPNEKKILASNHLVVLVLLWSFSTPHAAIHRHPLSYHYLLPRALHSWQGFCTIFAVSHFPLKHYFHPQETSLFIFFINDFGKWMFGFVSNIWRLLTENKTIASKTKQNS